MAELVSPFAEVARRAAAPWPSEAPGVTLAPLRIHRAWDVQAFDRSGSANAGLAKALRLPAPAPGQCVGSKGVRLLRTDVGRWIVHADADLPQLHKAAGSGCGVTDIGHARAGFRLSGAATAVLRKLVRVDPDGPRLSVGRVAELQLHHLGVLVIRTGADACDIYALSSFAEDVWEAVADASIEFGYRIEAEQGF